MLSSRKNYVSENFYDNLMVRLSVGSMSHVGLDTAQAPGPKSNKSFKYTKLFEDVKPGSTIRN